LYMKLLANEQNWGTFKNDLRLAFDIGLLIYSAGGYNAARSAVSTFFRRLDIVLPIIDIAIHATDLPQDPEYSDFVEVWNTVYLSYAAVSVIRLTSPLFEKKMERFAVYWRKNYNIVRSRLKLSQKHCDDVDEFVRSVERKITTGAGKFGKYSTTIDDAVELLAKDALFGDDALTFLDATYRTVKTKNAITLYRSFGAPKAKLGGTFSTPTKSATRNELAILEEWGNSMRFEAKVTVPKDTKLNIGKVAPQTGKDGIVLEGLGEQVILPYKWDKSWVNEIVDTQTGKVYKSLNEFKMDFPTLVD
jgi:hypothetical protein